MMNYRNMCVALCLVGSASLAMAAEALAVESAEPAQPAEVTAVERKAAPATDEAAGETSTDASQGEGEQAALLATIRKVKGIVQYRTGDDQPWQKVEVGQQLAVGVEFRTGPRSAVTFHLPPDQLITLDRLGTLKLLDALHDQDKTRATTELGMRYGRTRYQVEGSQGVEHHATIRSPNATLAIRGTQDVTLTDEGPGIASATSINSRVFFRPKGSPTQVAFGSNYDGAKHVVKTGHASAAEHRMNQRVVDPSASQARSQAEFEIMNDFELYNGPALSNKGIRNIVNTPAPVPNSDPSDGCSDFVLY